MSSPPAVLWFDYIDPASRLVEGILAGMSGGDPARGLVLRPLEVVPPPGRPLDPASDPWRGHLERMAEEAPRLGLTLRPPPLVPWTRKAHELAFHAREKGCFPAVHRAIFDAFFQEGLDIGRVDVLVSLAAGAGLDPSEAKAVLDVDRFAEAVEDERRAAAEQGIRGVPTVVLDGRRLEGFPSLEEVYRFLGAE